MAGTAPTRFSCGLISLGTPMIMSGLSRGLRFGLPAKNGREV